MTIIKNTLSVLLYLFLTVLPAFCDVCATADFQVTIPEYTKIEPITSPVLTANITNRTGNLYTPLNAGFRVTTNAADKKIFYLSANTTTEAGYENAMFSQGGQVYIAFANLSKTPSSFALANCKNGSLPKDSPGVVAYPVISLSGAEYKYLQDDNKYELSIGNGITNVAIHVGSNVLKSSFAGNDPKGFYQAIISMTEADI